jgi:UDP-N-acetylglucosamine 3-dehydrogenase
MLTAKIGIIGIGNMGRIHARILSSLDSLAGVTDIDFESAKAIAENYGVKAYEDYNDMLDDLSLDGVIVSTPTSTHADIATKVVKNHSLKGIMIEKPLASTLIEGEKLLTAIKKKGMGGVVCHSEIYNPVVDRTLAMIKEGAIGETRVAIHDRRGFVHPSRIPSLGDVFEDLGVHDFDIMARMNSGPAKVYAQGNLSEGVYNSGTVLVKFRDGVQHSFHLSREYAGRSRSMDVSGTKGALVLDLFGQIIKVKDLDQEPSAGDRTIRLPERGATIKVYGEPIFEAIKDFIRVIETGSEPIVGLEDGINALRVVEAARKSAKTGDVIDLKIAG